MLTELRNAVRRSAEQARNRRAYRTLLELDDHLLRDIGLPRDELRSLHARIAECLTAADRPAPTAGRHAVRRMPAAALPAPYGRGRR